MGRPRSEMTEENIEKILKTVALGMWPDRAADMHGISKSAMRQHKRRNPDFVTALKRAEAQAEAAIQGKILRHMDKQWTAAAWMLERRWPERWAKREVVIPANKDDARAFLEQVRQMREMAGPQEPMHEPPAA